MNSKVAKYLVDGCMQCKLGATLACKINHWQKELRLLRDIILACGLKEDFIDFFVREFFPTILMPARF
jgi:hypothetical protein